MSVSRQRTGANVNRFLLFLATSRAPQDSEQASRLWGREKGRKQHSHLLSTDSWGPSF